MVLGVLYCTVLYCTVLYCLPLEAMTHEGCPKRVTIVVAATRRYQYASVNIYIQVTAI